MEILQKKLVPFRHTAHKIRMSQIPPFSPPFYLRPAMVQTLLASKNMRNRQPHAMNAAAQEVILDCGPHNGEANVRLMGMHSKAQNERGLVILLHGWMGCHDSNYVASAARTLFEQGFSIFRLNYRDHGPTSQLNEGLFNATLLPEVFAAVQQLCEANKGPVYLIGFSLGGNFALRIAREMRETPLPNIQHIFSISPVIDPQAGVALIDGQSFIRRYFVDKWHNALRAKQAAFPHIYNLEKPLEMKTIKQLSDHFIQDYSDFPSDTDFFNGYRLFKDDLMGSDTPISIIAASDDPVCATKDIHTLHLPETAQFIEHPLGGHNGFFESLTGQTWYEKYICKIIL